MCMDACLLLTAKDWIFSYFGCTCMCAHLAVGDFHLHSLKKKKIAQKERKQIFSNSVILQSVNISIR